LSSLEGYRIPAGPARAEQTIRRSRFLALADHAPTPEAAAALVASARREHPDARHHCWAFRAGDPGGSPREGMSDDGEPRGTAGRPILEVLRGSGIGELVVVVVRYYGGIKLGTGGLARAYSGTARLALDVLDTGWKVPLTAVAIRLPFELESLLRRILADRGLPEPEPEYGQEVTIRLTVPCSALPELTARVTEASRGRARLEEERG